MRLCVTYVEGSDLSHLIWQLTLMMGKTRLMAACLAHWVVLQHKRSTLGAPIEFE